VEPCHREKNPGTVRNTEPTEAKTLGAPTERPKKRRVVNKDQSRIERTKNQPASRRGRKERGYEGPIPLTAPAENHKKKVNKFASLRKKNGGKRGKKNGGNRGKIKTKPDGKLKQAGENRGGVGWEHSTTTHHMKRGKGNRREVKKNNRPKKGHLARQRQPNQRSGKMPTGKRGKSKNPSREQGEQRRAKNLRKRGGEKKQPRE